MANNNINNLAKRFDKVLSLPENIGQGGKNSPEVSLWKILERICIRMSSSLDSRPGCSRGSSVHLIPIIECDNSNEVPVDLV